MSGFLILGLLLVLALVAFSMWRAWRTSKQIEKAFKPLPDASLRESQR